MFLLLTHFVAVSWVTVLWSMIAAGCLTLAGVNFLVWCRQRKSLGYLLFALSAIGTAGTAGCELWMMQAETTAQFGEALRWLHLPVWLTILALVGFVRVYLHAGRLWLGWVVCGIRTLSLVLNFLFSPNLNFREITALRQIPFLGEMVSSGTGVANPWMLVGQLSLLLLVVFILDATVTLWRRGDRRRAIYLGGSMNFFVVLGTVEAIFILWEVIRIPLTPSVFYTGVVVAMSYELSRDVLRAVRLTRDLSESEKRMNLAAQAANLGFWAHDLVTGQIWATEKCRALLGFTTGKELVYGEFMNCLHPEDRRATQEAVDRALAERTLFETQYRTVWPNGTEHWISATGQAEYDEMGRPTRLLGVCVDITTRRLAEQEMQELRHELAHAGRVTMLGQLASTLAHELNQPLGAILRNAEAAELFLKMPHPDLDEVLAILADIRKDDQRAGSVIDRMRSLLKRRNLEAEPLEISELVGEVIAFIQADADSRHVKLITDLPKNLPLIQGDRVQLQQVFLNLLLNGMDALNGSSDGPRQVSVRTSCEGVGPLEIEVHDTGHGLSEEKAKHIFEPFFTTKPQGMGIGLAISRTIINGHNGQIVAINHPKGGAIFRVSLPIQNPV